MIIDHIAKIYASLIMKDEKSFKDIKDADIKAKVKEELIKKGASEDKYTE